MTKEIRTSSHGVEIRADENGVRTVAGYASVFHNEADAGTTYHYGKVSERIGRNAFARAIEEKQDVRALFNHDANKLLGRTASGTCRLFVDERGLRYEVDLPKTALGDEIAELVGRGDITGSSFAFNVKAEKWSKNGDGTYTRTIEDVDLFDVSPVTYPAYESTSAAMRAEDIAELETRAAAACVEPETNDLEAEAAAKAAEAEGVKSKARALLLLARRHN